MKSEIKEVKITRKRNPSLRIFLPAHIWRICKVARAAQQPKICKRAKFTNIEKNN